MIRNHILFVFIHFHWYRLDGGAWSTFFSNGFAFVGQVTDEEPGVNGFMELVTSGVAEVEVEAVQQAHAHAVRYDQRWFLLVET